MAVPEVPVAIAQPDRVERHVVDGNLAPAVMGRAGLTYQYLAAPHHAVVATIYRQLPVFLGTLSGGLTGVGGELGWRFHSDRHAPTGIFAGVAATLAHHTTNETRWFTTYGASADAGYALLVGRTHLVFGAGVQVARSDIDRDSLEDVARFLVGTGVTPRLTLAIGQALGH